MRLRLVLSFILIVLVTIVVFAVVMLSSTAREVNAFMLRGGMTGLDELVVSLEAYYTENGSWQGVARLFGGAGMGQGPMHGGGPGRGGHMGGMMDQRLVLADPQGNVLVDTGAEPGAVLTSEELESAVPLHSHGDIIGYLLAQGGMPVGSAPQQNLISRINRAAVTAALVATALSLVLALLLAYGLLRPVRDLAKASRAVAAGDLSHRVRPSGGGEIAQLGRDFNSMADSLRRAEETRKSLTADIAHELRTPLAVQRAHLEALQDGVYPLTPENLNPVLEQTLTLARLVEDLRTLALADAGELPVERKPVDYPALIRRTVQRFKPQAKQRHVKLFFESQVVMSPLSLDETRIEQSIGNLIANALRFTPEGGKIEVRLDLHEYTHVRLTVRDTGPGIPLDDLPHIFDRFYRAGKSRTRTEGGSGLGLAIARKLVESHGGSLTAANHPDGGAIFTLDLPLKPYAPSK